MSMYALVHGENPRADLILAALDLTRSDVGRFRDAFVADGEIAVYTRNGGGNRECWDNNEDSCDCPGCIITHRLPKHPHYLRDDDDDFDCTYATIYFRIPPDAHAMLAKFESGKFDPDARWLAALDELKVGKRPEVVERLRPLIEEISRFTQSEAIRPNDEAKEAIDGD